MAAHQTQRMRADAGTAEQAPARRGHGLITPEWLAALRRGRRPMPATLIIAVGCLGVWLASLATGGSLWSGSVHGPVDHALARNAVLIADGQWWRALSYGTPNLSLFAFAYTMALFLLAGMQVERTYGTARYLAVLVPSWTTGALVGLLVEPAAAFNAGTSGATFGVAAAATIDLLRRGVPWHRTFWVPTLAIILVLGFIFPASVTWGAHVGGILAGTAVGAFACAPASIGTSGIGTGSIGTGRTDSRRLAWTVILAVVLAAGTLLAVPAAAHHTVSHGPVFVAQKSSSNDTSPVTPT